MLPDIAGRFEDTVAEVTMSERRPKAHVNSVMCMFILFVWEETRCTFARYLFVDPGKANPIFLYDNNDIKNSSFSNFRSSSLDQRGEFLNQLYLTLSPQFNPNV